MKWTDIGVACAAALIGIAVCAPALAQQKTAKECQAEWKANKAAIQASGKTKKVFVSECRNQTAAAQPAQQPTPAPAPPQSASRATPERTTTTRSRQTATAPMGAGQFSTEVAAKAHCPSDTVVWVNLDSKIYHFNGTRDYGHTKRGAFMCEREAYGYRAAKNEKHP
jgi:hypothetical protein